MVSQAMALSETFPPLEVVPRHVAFIMDGNGRWARQRGLPRSAGHRAGRDTARRVVEACADFGIRYVTLYAFSTENWKRPLDEVRSLMDLFADFSDEDIAELQCNGVQVRHIGRLEGLPSLLRHKIQHVLESTRRNDRLIMNIALNYGGRAELVDAVKQIIRDSVKPEEVDEPLISRYLYTAGVPDPDLVVRTAGEMRLSNFLIWQAAYAEYYSTPTYWPDFGKRELYEALLAFSRRSRRFGQLDEQVRPA